jgi:putative NADPH-quinone reductase
MSREERLNYHDETVCTKPVQAYVDRLRAAQGLVLVNPVWNYGYPAILKGFFDRVFLPGVSFRLVDGALYPNLRHIRRIAAVHTYGGNRLRTMLMGDPPRRNFRRWLRLMVHPLARARYLALYDMNNNGRDECAAFIARVAAAMQAF